MPLLRYLFPGPETHDDFHRGIQGQATGVAFFWGSEGEKEGEKVWDMFGAVLR